MKKKDFVSNLTAGEDVADLFIISEASRAQAKNGPYWQLLLKDKTGTLPARMWSPLSLAFQEIPTGTLAFVRGRTSMYGEALQLVVEGLELLTAEELAAVDMSLFLPSSPVPAVKMWEELCDLCAETLVHPPLRTLALAILNDETLKAQLLVAPAAKGVHHAYRGGLLEHTLAVCRLCMLLANSYPELDRQILLVGALCHDIGKLAELTSGNVTEYTDEGRLLGHIGLGMEILDEFLQKTPLEKELAFHLRHLVLSHHGELEFGSPKRPKTPEAFALHLADNFDAKLAMFRDVFKDVPEGAWSPFNKIMDRFLYRPIPSPVVLKEGDALQSLAHISDQEEKVQEKNQKGEAQKAQEAPKDSYLYVEDARGVLVDTDFDEEDDSSFALYELENNDMWEVEQGGPKDRMLGDMEATESQSSELEPEQVMSVELPTTSSVEPSIALVLEDDAQPLQSPDLHESKAGHANGRVQPKREGKPEASKNIQATGCINGQVEVGGQCSLLLKG